ncbi:MAG: DUF4347 domain-containing protein [Cyanobacteriota bacterium]|nr:DUF4347 domain-containing protein [Cyanobacteriota bacterium]
MLDTSKVKNQGKTIAFIDARAPEYQSLVEGVTEGVEAIVLEGDRDGIETITATLEKYASRHEEIEAVHIISHGSAGSLQLGNKLLNRDTLTEYRSQLGRWSEALTSTAEILLYGCNVAAGMGANFVRQLSELTGAKIAASLNLTGNALKGGDWNLGFRTGEIKAPIALVPEVMATYGGVLAILTVTNANDSGVGSLREAIASAQSGDTIKFDSSLANQTITLISGQLTVNKDLIIDGGDAAGLTISGNNASRAIELVFQNELTVKNLNFVDGKTNEEGVPGSGGAIWTASQTTLTVENSSFSNNATAGYGGGAIWAGHKSNTTVINSKFDSNDATLGQAERGGGAISTNGFAVLTVKDSEFTNNKGINGGAINSVSTALTVENSQFINNDTTPGALLESSSSSPKGFGGAIYTDGVAASFGGENGTIAIRNSLFDGNKGAGAGGAAFLFIYPGDDVVVENTRVINNSVIENYIDTAQGGGIRLGTHGNGSNLPSKFAIRNSTFAGNTAEQEGGGLWIDRKLDISETEITNSTFSGNRARETDGTRGYGGAIVAYSPTSITNTTITDNYAANQAGAIYTNPSPSFTAPIEVTNTIFGQNNAAVNYEQTNVQLIDGGNNLQYPSNNSSDTAIANITIADPKLGPLEEINGKLIHPLLEGSPAINAGTTTNAPTEDQLGQSRVGQVDIGAYEFTDTTPPSQGEAIYGGVGGDILNGTDGDDTLSGQGGNDLLNGRDGNDVLNGGDGVDTTNGGAGDDIYIVDNSNDIVNELANSGIDVVRSSASYSLRANIENLVLTENSDIDGTGNNSDNRITGNDGNNQLIGGNGNDTLVGNAGNDTFNGGPGDDLLNGGDGNDILNGWTGADTANGGAGDDIYIVDNSNDIVNELANSGTDTVQANLTYTLKGNIENLVLTEDAPIDGTGNNSDNRITGNGGNNQLIGGNGNDTLVGNAGNDTFNGGPGDDLLNGGDGNDILNGWTGADTANGGAGDDIYIVDSSNDIVNELANSGTDIVRSSASYSLRVNIENLVLTENSDIDGTGNNSDNRITGNDGNNQLIGGNGNDTLVGNAGNDTFNGGPGDDLLNGGDGNDILNGWTGADTANGGAGDDIYIVDNSNDIVNELVNSGIDIVQSNVTYSLRGNIENLVLTENSDLDGTGNNSDNRITGNDGNNKLNGGNGDDVVTGNSGDDTLMGASGVDTLSGGPGNDSLIGHGESDRFLYDTGSSFSAADVGQDIIADFDKTENDKIVLDKTTFDNLSSSTGLGFSIVAEFEAVTSDAAAATSDAAIAYNTNNGKLFYNPDGSAAGFGSGGLFATLSNAAQLEANDFVLQS